MVVPLRECLAYMQQQLVIAATLLSLVSLDLTGALPLMFHYDPLIAEESQPQEQQQLSIAPFVVTAPLTQQGSEEQQETSDRGQGELPAAAVRHGPQYSESPAVQPAKRHTNLINEVPQEASYKRSPATAQASYAPAGLERQGDLQGSATGYGHQAEGYLDMGAYSSGYGAFGWYADYPVGGGYH
ncbi:hypothetical protein HPB50_023395 [Hyalomma asiaticum]|uniref:Uncharacterized protein n=1 Tax=Hyalomma asiaticum TaxID=266040 RepID=A0ACB7S4S6_HYAAI|nr:hypothetical protein HPB50_023395 [Hyalomma asiaticum]